MGSALFLRTNRARDEPAGRTLFARHFVRQFSPKQSEGRAGHQKMGGGNPHEFKRSSEKDFPC